MRCNHMGADKITAARASRIKPILPASGPFQATLGAEHHHLEEGSLATCPLAAASAPPKSVHNPATRIRLSPVGNTRNGAPEFAYFLAPPFTWHLAQLPLLSNAVPPA